MNLIDEITKIYRMLFRKRTSHLDFLFIFFCVWTLISVGEEAQYYLFKFIGSDSATLYGSAFEDAIAKIPDLNNYMLMSYSLKDNYNYIAAFLIVLTSFFFQSSLQIFFASVISSIFILTATDIAHLLISSTLTIQSAVECFIANLFGSLAISAFIIFIYCIKKNILSLNNVNIKVRHLSSYISYVSLCLLILIVSYYIICFFYRPTSINFSVSTSQDFSGNYFITSEKDEESRIKNQEKKEEFSIFGKPVKIEKEAQITGKITEINSKIKDGESYNLTVSLLTNCPDDSFAKALPSESYYFSNVQSLKIKPSESLSMIWISDKDGHTKLTDEIVNLFSVKRNGNNSYDISKTNDGTAYYFPSHTDGGIYIATPTIDYEKNKNKKNSSFTLTVNGITKEINIESERLRSSKLHSPLKCEVVPINKLGEKIIIKKSDAIIIGLFIKIDPISRDEFYSPEISNENSHLEIKGEILSLINKDINKDKLLKNYFKNGYTGGIVLHSFDKLSINGKNVESNSMDNIIAIGDDIYTHTSLENNLVSTGKVSLFYRNRLRENKTLWEDSSNNTLLIGGVGTLILSLLTLAIKMIIQILRKDEHINVS